MIQILRLILERNWVLIRVLCPLQRDWLVEFFCFVEAN